MDTATAAQELANTWSKGLEEEKVSLKENIDRAVEDFTGISKVEKGSESN